MSETAPSQGTLKVFPDVLLSNAYIMMRPFFRPVVSSDSQNPLDAKNWEYGGTKSFKFFRGSSNSALFQTYRPRNSKAYMLAKVALPDHVPLRPCIRI